MLRVVYNEYKGYCVPRSRHEAEDPERQDEILTDGFDLFDWSNGGGKKKPNNWYDALQDDSSDDTEGGDMYGDESSIALNHGAEPKDLITDPQPEPAKVQKGKMNKRERKEARKMKNLSPKKGSKKKRSNAVDLERSEPSDPNKVKVLNRLYKQLISEVGDGDSKRVKDDFKVLQFFDVSLYKEDVDNLKDDEWLSDNNISFVFEYLERYQLTKFDKLVSQAIQLVRPSMVHLLAMLPNPEDLKGVIPPLEKAKFIFLPINDSDDLEGVGSGFHWSLVVISMLDATAFIYDSLDRANETEARKLIGKVEQYLGGKTTFEIKVMDTPQQINGSDCGMMVTQISAFLLSRLLKLNYLKDHYVNLDLVNVKISAIGGRIFSMGTLLNLIRHKKDNSVL